MKFFKSEFKEQLIFSAWLFQSEFHMETQENGATYVFNNSSLEILKHSITLFFDELENSMAMIDKKKDTQDMTENWLEIFHKLLKDLVNKMIESECIEPTSKILYALVSNDENSIFMEQNQDDKLLKGVMNNTIRFN